VKLSLVRKNGTTLLSCNSHYLISFLFRVFSLDSESSYVYKKADSSLIYHVHRHDFTCSMQWTIRMKDKKIVLGDVHCLIDYVNFKNVNARTGYG